MSDKPVVGRITFDSAAARPGWSSEIGDLVEKAKARTPAGRLPSAPRIIEADERPCPVCGGTGRLSSRVTCRACRGWGSR